MMRTCGSPILQIERMPQLLKNFRQQTLQRNFSRGHSPKASVNVQHEKPPHVLTVSGSDSGAGAGIQADLKACGAVGVYCSTVITAITAQNTVGIQGIHLLPEDIFSLQLESILSDMEVDVVKTGMLPSAQYINTLCNKLKLYPVRGLVVDPVMDTISGYKLVNHGPDFLNILCKGLLPMADIVTPNLAEASILLGGKKVHSLFDVHDAAKAIKDFGPQYVLIRGGHSNESDTVIDVLYDGSNFYELPGKHVVAHGIRCTLASSISAEMAKGSSVQTAVQVAKQYVEETLYLSGKDLDGPLHPFFKCTERSGISKQKKFDPSCLRLYAVTDSNMNKRWQRSISEAVKAAIEGGATIVQLREKEAESKDFLEEAFACVDVARESGVPIIINDRLDIALVCGADGVHLGQSDIPVSRARELLGPDKIIGASCKTVEQACKAYEDGADYIGSGGVYPTTTKKNNRTIGLEGLDEVCKGSPLPVVAIGGISAANVEYVFAKRPPNLYGVAVVSALFDMPDVFSETQKLSKILSTIFGS